MKQNKNNKPKPSAAKPKGEPTPVKSGIHIESRGNTEIKGDVIQGDKITNNSRSSPREKEGMDSADQSKPAQEVPQSAWSNGLFYLFIFVVVAGVVGWLAGKFAPLQVGLIVVSGLLAIPLVGAFQLRMDKRLSEKNFYELIKLTIRQLPIIRGFTKTK